MGTEPLIGPELAKLRKLRGRQRAMLCWSRPAATLLLAAANIVITARGNPGPAGHGTGLLVSVALAGVLIGLVTGSHGLDRRPALVFGGAALLFVSGAGLFWLQQPHPNGGLLAMGEALVFCAYQLRRRPAVFAAVCGVALAVLVAEGRRHSATLDGLINYLPFVCVCWLALLFRRLRDARDHAETLLVQLEESRGAEARAATLAERQRLAREMHDVLAHSLSGLMLQLEGARMLAEASPADPRLPEAVGRAHELARDGLDEARRAIGMLRGEELPGPAALDTLTGQFERHSGIPCSFAISGQPWPVSPEARLALYRVTQEALTNVIRHADAQRVEVRLGYAPGRISLTIEDFSAGPGSGAGDGRAAAGSGHGLTGMRERAELLGGTLAAGATPTGFRVELLVPA